MNEQRRKIIIIGLGIFGILLLLIIIIGVFNYLGSNLAVFNSYKSMSISNGWATTDDFTICTKEESYPGCIVTAYKMTRVGIDEELTSYGLPTEDIDTKIAPIADTIDTGKYKDAYKQLQLVVADEKAQIKASGVNKEDISKSALSASGIKSATASVETVVNGWSVVIITPKSTDYDTGVVIMKKNGDKWVVAAGPGTDFDSDQLSLLGVPSEIINRLQNGSHTSDEVYY